MSVRRYFKRIYEEADNEFKRYGLKSLPFIEAVTVMILVSRGTAEATELFPYSISSFLVDIAVKWCLTIAPYVNAIYSALGYPFAPDVTLMHKYPVENPIYPTPVWMFSLWTFSIVYTFGYWIILTLVTYYIGRFLGGKGSFVKLLTWIGIAHIPIINWWFYNGCEMLYEIVQQEIYLSLTPPYYKSATKIEIPTPWGKLPSYLPIEAYWAGYAFALGSIVITVGLVIASIYLEHKLNIIKTVISASPWLIYLILIVLGSLNISEICSVLNEYVRSHATWSWFGG